MLAHQMGFRLCSPVVCFALGIALALMSTAKADSSQYAEGVGSGSWVLDAGSGWQVGTLTRTSLTGTYLSYGTTSPRLVCYVLHGQGAESDAADIEYSQAINWVSDGSPAELDYTMNSHATGFVGAPGMAAGADAKLDHRISESLVAEVEAKADAPTSDPVDPQDAFDDESSHMVLP